MSTPRWNTVKKAINCTKKASISLLNTLKVIFPNSVCLTSFSIAETDANLVAKVKVNLDTWIKEAQSMEATVYKNQPAQTTTTKPNQNYDNGGYASSKQDTSAPGRFDGSNQGRDISPPPDNRDKSAPAP